MGDTRRRVPWWLVAVGAVVAIVVGAGIVVVTRDGGSGSAAPGELRLEPIGTPGDDPFTESVAAEEVAVGTAVSSPDGTDDALEVAGSQPGLYGGTQDDAACDAGALVDFLEKNSGQAAAWAGVLGIDADGIRDYVGQLTPVVLRTDTRVTNHGFFDGRATPRQSVLQAGTAIMVDAFGVPRVRCSCGNPLTEPAALPSLVTARDGSVTIIGRPWPRWDPAVVVIVNATVEVTEFTIFDIETEREYTQPIGSDVNAPTGDATVLLLPGGLGIADEHGALAEEIPFGTPLDEARARLTEALGEPTGEESPPPEEGTDCVFDSIYWNELTVYIDRTDATLHAWEVSSVRYDRETAEPNPVEVRGIARTLEGIALGSSLTQLQQVYPELTGDSIESGFVAQDGRTYQMSSTGTDEVARIISTSEC